MAVVMAVDGVPAVMVPARGVVRAMVRARTRARVTGTGTAGLTDKDKDRDKVGAKAKARAEEKAREKVMATGKEKDKAPGVGRGTDQSVGGNAPGLLWLRAMRHEVFIDQVSITMYYNLGVEVLDSRNAQLVLILDKFRSECTLRERALTWYELRCHRLSLSYGWCKSETPQVIVDSANPDDTPSRIDELMLQSVSLQSPFPIGCSFSRTSWLFGCRRRR